MTFLKSFFSSFFHPQLLRDLFELLAESLKNIGIGFLFWNPMRVSIMGVLSFKALQFVDLQLYYKRTAVSLKMDSITGITKILIIFS